MAKNVVIRDVVYSSVPSIEIPLSTGSGNAVFVDTSDATLDSASNLPSGVTAYADGVKYTGTASENDSSDLTVSGATVTVPAGYYSSDASKSVASGSVTSPTSISGTSASVSTGTNTLTLTKSVSVTPRVTTAGYVSSGTAGDSSVSLTASVTTRAAASLQPSTSAVTIPAGTYLTGAQTIPAEPNYVASSIVYGKSLWGLNGSAQIPVISYDTTTHILSIS